jgi:choline dehydrogenase-like flavoprotein
MESMVGRYLLVEESKLKSGSKISCSLKIRILGGSSTCNGTLCIKGLKEDYDEWRLDGWSGEEVFRYMSKVKLCFIIQP